jgi:hypothetical protein
LTPSSSGTVDFSGFFPTIFAALHLTYQQNHSAGSLTGLLLFFFATKQLAIVSC